MSTAVIEEEQQDGQEPEEHLSPEELRLDQAAEKIRLRYKGIRVHVSGFPQSRKLSDTQKKRAAREFNADEKMISASSKLWDRDELLIKDVRSVINSIDRAWHDRSKTLPTTTDGLRKIKRECVGLVHEELIRLKAELCEKCQKLKDGLPGVISRLKESKSELFNEEDYNGFDPVRDIDVKWSFPVVTEDNELAELDDSVYQYELQRVRSEGRESVKLFEEKLAFDLCKMLDAIVERLEGVSDGGKKKTFRDNTVGKLFGELEEFETQLKDLGVGGKVIGAAMSRLRRVTQGHDATTLPEALRQGSPGYRDHVREKFDKISKLLESKALPEQRRSVLRLKRQKRREAKR